jgi:ADP-heptose:LPS heptosyltransferase
VIQTAFIGDVILSTALIENLAKVENCQIDFLLRKGNETLLKNNPHIHKIIIWEKQNNKWKSFFEVLKYIRNENYDDIINLQRFFTTGLFSLFSNAKRKIGFDKNPLSFFYDIIVPHQINNGLHEVDRNNLILEKLNINIPNRQPKLYPSKEDFKHIEKYCDIDFVTIAPASVWFTKQFPMERWVELCNLMPDTKIYLLGGKGDLPICNSILEKSTNKNIEILAGNLNFLQSAALMKNAKMNYTNDSAPLHIASAMNAPVKAVFCSTIPEFGFGPVNDNGKIVEIREKLNCRPCGLHGLKSCPKGHFKCAKDIVIQDFF